MPSLMIARKAVPGGHIYHLVEWLPHIEMWGPYSALGGSLRGSWKKFVEADGGETIFAPLPDFESYRVDYREGLQVGEVADG